MDPFGERRGFELRARIAAGLFELEQDIPYGRQWAQPPKRKTARLFIRGRAVPFAGDLATTRQCL